MASPEEETKMKGSASPEASSSSNTNYVLLLLVVVTFCAIIIVGELASIISIENDTKTARSAASPPIIINQGTGFDATTGKATTSVDNVPDSVQVPFSGENVCAGKNPQLENTECVLDAMVNVGPQAGANVTEGYNGDLETDSVPITTPFWQNAMCPVNVHWHLGAEHYSVGEYDETGDGPNGGNFGPDGGDGGVQPGYRCTKYDATDPMFTKQFDWKHCISMEVGETYEVHWPHSAAGACGTPNQYQTPFADGVFCTDGVLGADLASQIGVQAQVFVVVNDESYFYPDLIRGLLVDGEMGQDIAKYTGSTTGSNRNNRVCSAYSPITWQVDRKCHLISASSFDKLCADMKSQRDDMSNDLFPHGSRELVDDELAANNHQRYLRF